MNRDEQSNPHTCESDHGNVPQHELRRLPYSQKQPGRHRCAACAYEAGIKAGHAVGHRQGFAAGCRAKAGDGYKAPAENSQQLGLFDQ